MTVETITKAPLVESKNIFDELAAKKYPVNTDLVLSDDASTFDFPRQKTIEELRRGLNILESKFSNNCNCLENLDCCQSECGITECSQSNCTVSCQSCQACQTQCRCQSCQKCQTSQCSNCNCGSNCSVSDSH